MPPKGATGATRTARPAGQSRAGKQSLGAAAAPSAPPSKRRRQQERVVPPTDRDEDERLFHDIMGAEAEAEEELDLPDELSENGSFLEDDECEEPRENQAADVGHVGGSTGPQHMVFCNVNRLVGKHPMLVCDACSGNSQVGIERKRLFFGR